MLTTQPLCELRSSVILGRADEAWRRALSVVGLPLVRGTPAGDVDVHLGNHRSIAHRHALIDWRADLNTLGAKRRRTPRRIGGTSVEGQKAAHPGFAITALATPVAVDGVEVMLGQSVALPSKSVIRGACDTVTPKSTCSERQTHTRV